MFKQVEQCILASARTYAKPLCKAVFTGAFFINALMVTHSATASPQEALQVLNTCLKGKTNPDDTLVCVGRYSDQCAATFDSDAPIPQITGQSECLDDETAAWNMLRDRAVTSWQNDNGTNFSKTIGKIAAESAKFSELKCSVFRDGAQFGQSGMALEAQCLLDEAARTTIFIGYSLD